MDSIQPVVAIVCVLALLGAVLLVLKKRGSASFHLPRGYSSGSRALEVMDRVSLGPQHALFLVRAGRSRVLIATTPSSCHIHESTTGQLVWQEEGEKP